MLKKSSAKILVGLLAVLLVLGCVCIGMGMKSTPQKTLNEYAKAVSKNDVDKIIKYMDPEEQEVAEQGKALMGDEFIGSDEDVQMKIIVDGVTYGEDGASAEVTCFEITEYEKSCGVEYTNYEMIKVNNKWYLEGLLY